MINNWNIFISLHFFEMLSLLISLTSSLNAGYHRAEIEDEEPYAFTIPLSHSAYLISNQKVDDEFKINLKKESQIQYQGESDSKIGSFRVDSNEVIIQNDDDLETQIWILQKEICDNFAYAFYIKDHSDIEISFEKQEKLCIFLPFLQSQNVKTTIKSNHNFSIIDKYLKTISPDDDLKIELENPFFIFLDDSISFQKVKFQIQTEKTNSDIDNCKFEPFSLFDFEKGFISKYDDNHIDYKSKCYNDLLLPIWAIIVILVICLILICLIITCCCCCGCCCCCHKKCSCFNNYKKTHGKSSSNDSFENKSINQQNPSYYPPPFPYATNQNDNFDPNQNMPYPSVQYPDGEYNQSSDFNQSIPENQIPNVEYPTPHYE
jgi:hypothetical protein